MKNPNTVTLWVILALAFLIFLRILYPIGLPDDEGIRRIYINAIRVFGSFVIIGYFVLLFTSKKELGTGCDDEESPPTENKG